jgi:hypothetical protein
MVAAMAAVGSLKFPAVAEALPIPHLTYWMETVMLVAFGFSWLIKGETFLKD